MEAEYIHWHYNQSAESKHLTENGDWKTVTIQYDTEKMQAKLQQILKDFGVSVTVTDSKTEAFKDGKYTGLEEQIAQLKKDNDWLFASQVPQSGGASHQQQNPAVDEFADFRKA